MCNCLYLVVFFSFIGTTIYIIVKAVGFNGKFSVVVRYYEVPKVSFDAFMLFETNRFI